MPNRKDVTDNVKMKRGRSRMAELGYKQICLWVDDQERGLLLAEARRRGKPLATFCRDFLIAYCSNGVLPRRFK